MNIKEYLNSILKREYAIQSMRERLDVLKSMAEGGASPLIDDMPRGSKPSGSSMEKFICGAMDLENEINKKEEELEKEKELIYNAISKLSVPEYEEMIYYRYLRGYSWKKVAEFIGYSTGWVYKACDKALEELREKLEVVA